ncbi:MAG: HEAT repeat domain-containing protein [Candidatus Dormibacteria bacterium]
MARTWELRPEQSVLRECRRRGEAEVVRGCVAILMGTGLDDALVLALGGPAARSVLSGGAGGPSGYWPRVWALRGLLYAWDLSAAEAVQGACGNGAWRVREMAAKVIAKRLLEPAFDAVAALGQDTVPRVRQAAERAVRALAAAGIRSG